MNSIPDDIMLYYLKNLDQKLIGMPFAIENYDNIKNDTIKQHFHIFLDIYDFISKNNGQFPSEGIYKQTNPWTLEFYIRDLMAMKNNELVNIRNGKGPFDYLFED